MNIEKTPSFEQIESNPKVINARKELSELLEIYTKRPVELLENYKRFEWLGKLEIKEYLKHLFEVQPSISKLREELLKFKTAKEDLIALSTNIVNYELFQIQCGKLKEEITLKIQKGIQALLKKIASFCEQEVLKIHKEYSFICEQILTIPKNEDELFELKQFAKSIRAKGLELVKKESEVLKHTSILEDYQYSINEEVSVKL